MDNFKSFSDKYGGAIIGFLIGLILSIILLCTELYKIVIGIALIVVCIYFGNYVQRNKENVKEKMKKFIDKL